MKKIEFRKKTGLLSYGRFHMELKSYPFSYSMKYIFQNQHQNKGPL